MLAMHMADSLLTLPVALVMMVLSAGVLAWAVRRTRRWFDPARVPLMGVLGAFVFAAQMINFPLPLVPGTSGHLGGGLLLAILLGPEAGVLVMASVLIVQCLIFQDGGLLALGANIFNLGVIPGYGGYALYRLLAGSSPSRGRAYVAVFVAALAGMTAGAACVPFEVHCSRLLVVPLSRFLLVMVGLHLIIAAVEAFITFGVVGYMAKVRPEAISVAMPGAGAGRLSVGMVSGSLLIVALLLAGVVSLHASGFPDALDSLTSFDDEARAPLVAANADATIQRVEAWHARHAPLPGYAGLGRGTSASGVIGTLVTLVAIWLIARALRPASGAGATLNPGAGGLGDPRVPTWEDVEHPH